ncbi:MAG: Fumarylacetoacetate hydrolase family protein, partial [uncultured Solirubrobacteraceae bacterium]
PGRGRPARGGGAGPGGRAARRPGGAAGARGRAGGVGLGRDLPPLGHGPPGGVRGGRRLRARLRRRAARALPQGPRRPRPAARRPAAHPGRLGLGRPGARARARPRRRRGHRGLPRGRRRLLPLHRGSQPALPPAGQDLRRRARPVGDDRPRLRGRPRPRPHGPDRAGDPPRRRRPLRRCHLRGRDAAVLRGAGRAPVPRALPSRGRGPAHGHGHRPARRGDARAGRRRADRDRRRRRAGACDLPAGPGREPAGGRAGDGGI